MRIANYVRDGQATVGLVDGEMIFNIPRGAARANNSELAKVNSLDEILAKDILGTLRTSQEKITGAAEGEPTSNARLLSPVLSPEKILLVAVNYVSHGNEQDVKLPPEPYFFTKFRNALVGPGDPIIVPRVSKKVDWEVELAAIIGKKAKYVARNDAQGYVAGYTISNDISFRDLQFPPGWPEKMNPLGQNWVKGKGLDNAFPLGPWLVTPDEIGDPYKLEISLSVNGNIKQKSTTAEMVFKLDSLIEYISAGMTLMPGDIISTGTPLGVAVFSGQPFLKDGDIVEAGISKIGSLRNPVKSE